MWTTLSFLQNCGLDVFAGYMVSKHTHEMMFYLAKRRSCDYRQMHFRKIFKVI